MTCCELPNRTHARRIHLTTPTSQHGLRIQPTRTALSRRAMITAGGVTVMGAGALVLAACSSGGSAGGSGGSGGSGTTSIAAGTVVARLADVPVGGTAQATVDGN